MTVPSNHKYVTGGDGICDVMLLVLNRAERVVEQQAREQAAALHARMQAQAEAHPRWHDMAGDIDYWNSEHGVTFGIPGDSGRVDQAVQAEYGDETYAPVALVRMGVINGVTEMGWSMQEAFARAGY